MHAVVIFFFFKQLIMNQIFVTTNREPIFVTTYREPNILTTIIMNQIFVRTIIMNQIFVTTKIMNQIFVTTNREPNIRDKLTTNHETNICESQIFGS